MDAKRSQQIRNIVSISQKMLELARKNEWEQVVVQENQRRELVMNFFKRPTDARDAAEVENAIRQILSFNQEVTELGRKCQAQVSGDIRKNTAGKAAQAAYLNCAR